MSNEEKTLRDEIAIAAMQGMLADPNVTVHEDTALIAYKMADFMLKVREEQKK